MKWNDVKNLHIEITANCNATCPQCPRHPSGSEFLLPTLENYGKWTLDDMEQRLPLSDLSNIESFFINGNYGDFVTHPQAIEIIEYLKTGAPNARVRINTNGSARNTDWWKKLATIKNLRINFAIDGLEDTHHLYRRSTNWKMILDNARHFVQAGGYAEWTMTIFEHNEHQVEECRKISNDLGFKTFYTRYSNRKSGPVINNDVITHIIRESPSSPINDDKITIHQVEILKKWEEKITKGIFSTPQDLNKNGRSIDKVEDCDSLKLDYIYIGSDWFVAPCCYIGAVSYQKMLNPNYADFRIKASMHSVQWESLFATKNNTVRQIIDRGFEWIYDKLLTSNCLSFCVASCSKTHSHVKIVRDFDKYHSNTP